MRVLHVSQPVDAGVAAVVAQLCVSQREQGWEPRVACPDGPLAARMTGAGIAVGTWCAGRSPGPATLAETRALAGLIRAHDPDVVHLHSSKAGLAGRLALRGRRPTLFQPHAWSFAAVNGTAGSAARRWERFGARWTHRLLCVSDDELAAGRAAGVAGPAVTVPNGVDTDRFRPSSRAAARAALGLPADARIVLCLGRTAEQKGQDLLLHAWPSVRSRHPDARLVLVGDGPRRAAWQSGCSDPTVLWRDTAGDPAPWYAAADVVALPSRWEGMPLVALEAMSAGRPVVGFDVAGLREAVGPDAGEVVAPGDVGALAAALGHRLGPDGRAAREGDAGRARVLERFDVRVMTAAVAALTTEVCEEGR
ncbi:glycosyltransferase family 1 protein [Pseudonocardia sp. P1]|nr:putative glycosyl transferase [Pseudonocardia sp. Ae707_Ps1]